MKPAFLCKLTAPDIHFMKYAFKSQCHEIFIFLAGFVHRPITFFTCISKNATYS
jgi:hypothetical protein